MRLLYLLLAALLFVAAAAASVGPLDQGELGPLRSLPMEVDEASILGGEEEQQPLLKRRMKRAPRRSGDGGHHVVNGRQHGQQTSVNDRNRVRPSHRRRG